MLGCYVPVSCSAATFIAVMSLGSRMRWQMADLFLCVDEPPLSVDDGMPDGWMMTGRIAGFSHDHPYEAAPIPRRSRSASYEALEKPRSSRGHHV